MSPIIDANNDGRIGKGDIDASDRLLELELREEKADSQRRMAWIAIISMIATGLIMHVIIWHSRQACTIRMIVMIKTAVFGRYVRPCRC